MPHVIAWPHGFGSNVSWRSVQELSRFGAIEKSPHSAKPEPIRDTLLGFPQTWPPLPFRGSTLHIFYNHRRSTQKRAPRSEPNYITVGSAEIRCSD
jgi:hypothetical protein